MTDCKWCDEEKDFLVYMKHEYKERIYHKNLGKAGFEGNLKMAMEFVINAENAGNMGIVPASLI
ncbi:hypothetical protein P9D43_14475 [Neobacillus niacini]|uniref:hypothetical protein n=1 Tax=Neobacillus niacini TaxID=86668 RepID=UPI0007AB5DD6|nr:hypothetical protein [Neobacillus niacini]MEC1523211.1 hypothetical protein [Neobacillus niacini]